MASGGDMSASWSAMADCMCRRSSPAVPTAMTGFAYPEMLVSVSALFAAGHSDEAEDLFDVYLPLVRHEQQPGFGLAVRKEILRRRGAIRSAAVRAPGPKLDALDLAELDRLLSRLETRLRENVNGRRLAVA